MEALLEAHPILLTQKREITVGTSVFLFVITVIWLLIIAKHTSNLIMYMYDVFAILTFDTNVILWLMIYNNFMEDSKFAHLLFFLTPILFVFTGFWIILTVHEIKSFILWLMCIITFVSNVVVVTIMINLLINEYHRINQIKQEGYVKDNSNPLLDTYV